MAKFFFNTYAVVFPNSSFPLLQLRSTAYVASCGLVDRPAMPGMSVVQCKPRFRSQLFKGRPGKL